LTDLEKRAITALQKVAMPSKGWHASRAEYLHAKMTLYPNARLVETQQSDLWFLVWHYRRQIADRAVVEHADALVNGALSLAFHGEPEG
jgi:hypothetical protein